MAGGLFGEAVILDVLGWYIVMISGSKENPRVILPRRRWVAEAPRVTTL
jgi:hypothetical protein